MNPNTESDPTPYDPAPELIPFSDPTLGERFMNPDPAPYSPYDPAHIPDQYNDYSQHNMVTHHCNLVKRLAKPGQDIIDSLTPEKAHLLHMVVGVSGEAGELLDAIKKHVIYNKPLDLENVVEEIGDIQFYLQGIMNTLNLGPDITALHNIIKLEKRYGSTYSDQAAQERADKCQEE